MVSYSPHTLYSTPSLLGGYEYIPQKMQNDTKRNIVDKHNESISVLPEIFRTNGFDVTLIDIPDINYGDPDKENIYHLAVGDVVAKYITVVDSLEKGASVQGMEENMKEGIGLIYKQILDVMTSLNVEIIPTGNEKFNPEFHDAVMHVESDEYDEKTVIEELRRGYKIKDRVIRHAMVKVAN